MKIQVFSFSRTVTIALSILFVISLTFAPMVPASAGQVKNMTIQTAEIGDDEVGGQGENGSSAPLETQTSAFLAGKVAVGVIAIESNGLEGSLNQENWTVDELQTVRNEIWSGLQKWVAWKPAAMNLEFVVDIDRDGMADDMGSETIVPVEIAEEPIANASGTYDIWTRMALVAMGYSAGTTAEDAAYVYASDLRTNNNADWAFVLFVVDSSNDNDTSPGAFTDGQYLISRTFGPLAVMTYNNGTRGFDNMEWATAQLVARMFGAGFQLEGSEFQPGGCGLSTKKFGYLGIANSYCAVSAPGDEPNPRLMYHGNGDPDSLTKKQIGWRDTDSDGIIDPMDTRPSVLFSPYPDDPTSDFSLVYSEANGGQYRAYDNPLASTSCLGRPTDECFYSYYYDVTPDNLAVTINQIEKVQFRLDGAAWDDINLATAQDGAFDTDYEIYTLTATVTAGGRHKIEVRAQNSAGNISLVKSDTVVVAAPPLNDLFADRIVIPSLAYNHAVDTAAIAPENEDDPTDPLPLSASCTNPRKGKRSVWYQYTADRDEEIYLDTFGTDYTTVLSVWRDNDASGVITDDELVECADGSNGDPTGLSFTPDAGATYYFMISEYNNIAGSAAGMSEIIGQAGGVLIFNVSEIKNPAYLPMLFKNAFSGDYDSAFYIQNISDSIPTEAMIKFYNSNGVLDCSISETIEPLASQGWWLPSLSCLPDNWVGSAHVTATQPVVAVARPHVGSEVMTYTGFTTGSTGAYMPMLFKNAFGGTYQSAFYIQNIASDSAANVTIAFYNSDGLLSCTINDSIQPLASKGWWVPGLNCLPQGWVGSAVVVASRNIVAVGRPHIGSEVMTYNGFTSGDITSYLPMLFKNAFGGGTYKSAFYIQNIHDSNPANVTIKYFNDAGVLNCTETAVVAPRASTGYWLPGVSCLPEGWVGGVEVTSTQPIVMVARPHIGTQITTYNSFAAGTISSYVPMLFKNAFSAGSYKAAFYIQNVNPFDTANITIRYYDSAGDLACTTTNTVSPLASTGYWLPGVSCLLDGWVGGAVITSDQPIVTVGRPHIGAQITTYSGFSVASENP